MPSNSILSEEVLLRRRENVFLILAGFFLSAMAILNLIGLTKFIQIGPLSVAVGILPYPLTFLCTDLISELYGRKRASFLVWVGLGMNGFILIILWLGHLIPAVSPERMPPWQLLSLAAPVSLPNGSIVEGSVELFQLISACTSGVVFASMVAYITAQFSDVYLFHFWKKLTQGRHLWLRNNGSTLISQFIDSFMVILITFGAAFSRGDIGFAALMNLFLGNYAFKLIAALLDTAPFYLGTYYLKHYLQAEQEIG
ncbi:MAG: queuosine precursor transporter [Prochloraceae cyanobacterium]|nr:queuosine precursor transporter [Prochloraceae cyanobacterium]